MKKTYTSILSLASLMGGVLLTSCLGDGTNKTHSEALFTVVKEGSAVSLYADYGGLVRPSIKSVSDLTNNEGLKDGDRVYMLYQYTDDNIKDEPGKGKYIIDAELLQGRLIPKYNVMMQSEAEAKHILDKDSLFTMTGDDSSVYFGAYRGYLTTRFNGYFSVVNNKGIYPSINMVYDPAENERPNELKLKLCYNRHTANDVQRASEVFFATYPLSAFSSLISGQDSITITIEGLGLTKARTLKIGREDLRPGNYRFFN